MRDKGVHRVRGSPKKGQVISDHENSREKQLSFISGHDYFRPFSRKGFYLCPSCSQKRSLLFAEHLGNEVVLNLPHRQFCTGQNCARHAPKAEGTR